jgi:type VI secretion system protein VasJ
MDLVSLGKEPIGAEQPAGSDVRYDESFDNLQLEIDKLTIPSATGSVDWEKVISLSSEILAHKSKDLLVAGYLAVALIHTHKDEGFAIGLKMYQDMLEHFWDDLYPPKKRMRGRAGAILWWLEKTRAALTQLEKSSLSEEQITDLKQSSEKIDQFLRANMEDPPLLSSIFTFINEQAARPEEETKSPEGSQPSPKPERESTPPEAAGKVMEKEKVEPPGEISSPEEAIKVVESHLTTFRRVASSFSEKDLSSPLLYRLSRASVWFTVDGLPPATDGRTPITPPAYYVMDRLKTVRESGDGEAVITAAEEYLYEFIFWLDLNRLVAEAMESLGNPYRDAQVAVCQETAFFIHRLPGLEELSFADGTPFADDDTKKWLKKIAFNVGTIGVAASPLLFSGSTDSEADLIRKEVEEARALITEKKLMEATERLQQKLRGCYSEKERLHWRLAISRLFLSTDNVQLSLSHLTQILKDIEKYRLEEYDPIFALECLKLIWLGFHSQSDDTSREKAAEMLQRIGRLDMVEAIRLEKD